MTTGGRRLLPLKEVTRRKLASRPNQPLEPMATKAVKKKMRSLPLRLLLPILLLLQPKRIWSVLRL